MTSLDAADQKERPATKREALERLPVIDIATFVEDGDLAARKEVAARLRQVCIDVGFFYLAGHGVPRKDFEELETQAQRFFGLPLDVKMRFASNGPGQPGFVRVGGVNPDANINKTPDLKERFVMLRNLTVEAIEASKEGSSHWPDEDLLPGFTTFMKRHIADREALTLSLGRAFALSLFLPENYFDEYFREQALVTLINFYPSLDEAELTRNRWSFSPHTDYGAFTILSQDSIGGLQVRNAAEEWIEVPPIENTFVVNIGDLMARWTNELYTSNLHRAANVSGRSRVSIPFFCAPHPQARIHCIETCTGPDNPPKYPEVICGEYLRTLITASDTTGQPGISKSTSERLKAN